MDGLVGWQGTSQAHEYATLGEMTRTSETKLRKSGACGNQPSQVIPGAGPVKRLKCPFSPGSPAVSRHAGSGAGVKGGAPGWTNDPGGQPRYRRHCGRREREYGVVCCPSCSLGVWQAPAAVIPSGFPRCWPREHGALRVRQRDQSEPRPRRPGRGPDLRAITRCRCPGLLTPPPGRGCGRPGTGPARRASGRTRRRAGAGPRRSWRYSWLLCRGGR